MRAMGRCGSLGKQLRLVLAAEKVNKKLHHCRDTMESTSDPTSQHLQSCQRTQQDVQQSVKATNSKTANFIIGLVLQEWGRGRNCSKAASD